MLSIPSTNFRSPAALARFLLVAAVALGLDLWTKAFAFQKLRIGGTDGMHESRYYEFIPGWLRFETITNPGAVFGLGNGLRVIFIAVSIAAIIFLFFLFAKSGRQWFYQIILGMLLAGVLGNLYDRIVFGEVRDMIKIFPRWPNLFPWIFNVADTLLCTGVGLMLLYTILRPAEPQTSTDPAAEPGSAKA